MTHTTTGNLGEAIAIAELSKMGYAISVPLNNNLPYDLLADKEGAIYKVQVKTSNAQKKTGWDVFIATSGGNTKQHSRKGFDNSRCDFLFVVAGLSRYWFIPTKDITAKDYITVGNKKYLEFEVMNNGTVAERLKAPDCKSGL